MSNNSDIDQLSQQLSKLSVRRSKSIAELQSIDKEYLKLERLIQEKRNSREILSQPEGKDSKGNPIRIGDSVTTSTKGKYYERIATITNIAEDNHIDIEYKESKKTTWRKGHNLLKLK